MLYSMNKVLIAATVVLMLSACAGNRYYAVEEAGGGQYYIGESPASIVYYPAAHAPLLVYGVSPWWGYSYYSPYFYPHYFSVSYLPWPYYAYWPVTHRYGYAPYGRHHDHRPGYYPGYHPGDEMPGMPSAGNYGPPATVPLRNAEHLRMLDDRSLRRELRRSGTPVGQAWNAPTARRSMATPPSAATAPPGSIRGQAPGTRSYGSPSARASSGHSASRARSNPGAVSRRNPRRHDQ